MRSPSPGCPTACLSSGGLGSDFSAAGPQATSRRQNSRGENHALMLHNRFWRGVKAPFPDAGARGPSALPPVPWTWDSLCPRCPRKGFL